MSQGLSSLFNPRTIALIGASRDPKSVGYGLAKNLLEGCVMRCRYCAPFLGKVFLVNPFADKILGASCHRILAQVKEQIDLAIIATPAPLVEDQVDACIKKRVKGVIIISAGFAEFSAQGRESQERIVKKLRRAKIPLIGPNCLGIIRTSTHLNASFAPSMPPKGNVAFVSQSGALADSIIDWAIEESYGFSSIVSLGNSADRDVSDFIEYFAEDLETKVIALYIESIRDGRRFLKVAGSVSKKKPIIVLKAGKTLRGVKAISSHTGNLAGDYDIYKAAFRQAGVVLAESVEEMFDIAKVFATQPVPKKNAIAIVTNGGGPGVLCADYCSEFGINLVELDKATIKELDRSGVMHPAYSRANPLDIVGDALPVRYKAALDILLAQDYIAGLIVIQTLQTMTEALEDAKIVIAAKQKHPGKPIICTYMGGKFTKSSFRYLEENGIPDYNDVRKSAKAMAALISRIGKK
ncbi:CoA-binding protein [Candidatus Woesearchaeota archaeon]|nr:CoA-binding protein [Candidatus Woesearchaeota archaeon]